VARSGPARAAELFAPGDVDSCPGTATRTAAVTCRPGAAPDRAASVSRWPRRPASRAVLPRPVPRDPARHRCASGSRVRQLDVGGHHLGEPASPSARAGSRFGSRGGGVFCFPEPASGPGSAAQPAEQHAFSPSRRTGPRSARPAPPGSLQAMTPRARSRRWRSPR